MVVVEQIYLFIAYKCVILDFFSKNILKNAKKRKI